MTAVKWIIESKAKGTNKWFSVNHPEFKDVDAVWAWYDKNAPFYLNYDLHVVEVTTSTKILTR